MSKILKSANRLHKKVWNGTKKVFKKITSTTIGKVVLVAAAIWLGGAALGAWKSGFAAVDGAFVGGGAAGGAAGGAVLPGAAPVATSSAATNTAAGLVTKAIPAGIETITVTGTAPAAGLTAGQTAAAAGTAAAATAPTASTAAPQMQQVDMSGVQGTAEQAAASAGEEATTGLISKLMKPVNRMATWSAEHPLPTMMAINGIGSALSPDAVDVAREQGEQNDQTRRRWEENLQVDEIDLGFRPSRQPLQYSSGGQVFDPVTGAINRQRRV